MRFADPYALLLLLLLPVWAYVHLGRKKKAPALVFASIGEMRDAPPPASVKFRHAPFVLRLCAVALLIVALARPQSGAGTQEITGKGIDIMLALDTSTSMDIMDMPPTRLEAAKNAILQFVERRKNDRIGLVVFAGASFTKCPLTLDYATLTSFIRPVTSGMVEDGTAIGMAIATSVNRLKQSDAKSRIVILLTDGMNNRGLIDPETAAGLAETEKVKIYTIGVGTRGMFYAQVDDPVWGKRTVPVQSDIDDDLLKKISGRTGGRYFAATDARELERIYEEIDRLEKSEVKSTVHFEYAERFMPFALVGLFLLCAEFVAAKKFIRSLPE
ncbi:MAG: VWA domain-containing protein [Nitrospinae bacterium]|nr:VWA domain-containing protein [Nitrospinota bacterium]